MDRFRYGRYLDGPDPLAPPYDVRGAMDDVGREILAGAKPHEALRELLRRGTRGSVGLDGLLRQVRQRRDHVRSSRDGAAPQEATSADTRRVRAMLDALNAMVDADERGEPVDFTGFMVEYGAFFPEAPRDLDELVDVLVRRVTAAQRLLASASPEQRQKLQEFMEWATTDAEIDAAVRRLTDTLRKRRPDLSRPAGEDQPVPEELGISVATAAVRELADLAELEVALGQDYPGASLEDVDAEMVHQALGRVAAEDVRWLQRVEHELREQGYLRGTRNRPRLTPKAVRRLGETALRDVSGAVGGRSGSHTSTLLGASADPTGASRPWEFGDERPLDPVRTLNNAVAHGRSTHSGTIQLRPEDIEVVETQRQDAAAVCLLVDLSYSMVRRDLWSNAKHTALALHSLVTTWFPGDAVRIIGFSDYARELPVDRVAELAWEPVQGTNLQHALLLAGRHLDRHSEFAPIVLIVTDGEPTTHLTRDGTATFSWPPASETTAATLAEVDRMTRRGAALNVFLLADDPRLAEFAAEMARRNGGRVAHSDPDHLGSHVVRDFLRRR